jgi:hypothetical protein
VRRQLSAENVVADVRLCLVRPEDAPPAGIPAPVAPPAEDLADEPEERSG